MSKKSKIRFVQYLFKITLYIYYLNDWTRAIYLFICQSILQIETEGKLSVDAPAFILQTINTHKMYIKIIMST